jgi:hypothetical protein
MSRRDLSYDDQAPADGSHATTVRTKVVEAKAPVCYIFVMKRDEAISRLQQHEADLKRLGVEHLYMFGATARDDSDVDLF